MTDEDLKRIYADARTIAVVGASGNAEKDANRIPAYMQQQGYRIIPVNPKGGELFGEKAYTSLADVEGPIDIVDVFRPPEEAEAVAREAVDAGAKVLWFQLDTHTDDAVAIAEDAGLEVVTGHCLGAAHSRLGLGPGPD